MFYTLLSAPFGFYHIHDYINPIDLLNCPLVAQEEMSIQDILVCGECHSVFHILELFQAHKMANNCQGQSNFKGNPSVSDCSCTNYNIK